MKLTVYEVADGHIAELGTVTEHDVDDPLHGMFPPVRGPGNQRLTPADGEPYLRAVHEEMCRGVRCWTELGER
jgi:hypothetical protein